MKIQRFENAVYVSGQQEKEALLLPLGEKPVVHNGARGISRREDLNVTAPVVEVDHPPTETQVIDQPRPETGFCFAAFEQLLYALVNRHPVGVVPKNAELAEPAQMPLDKAGKRGRVEADNLVTQFLIE